MNLIEITHPDVEQTTSVPEESLGHWARAGWAPVEQPTTDAGESPPDGTTAAEPAGAEPAGAEADTADADAPRDDDVSDEAAEEPQPKRRRRTT